MVQNDQKIRLFLSDVNESISEYREILSRVLQRAEIEVLESNISGKKKKPELAEIKKKLELSNCSVHIIGSEYGEIIDNQGVSLTELQLLEARKRITENPGDFRLFLWQPGNLSKKSIDSKQAEFINKLRNSIFSNMIFSNHDSPVVFVEDIQTIMNSDSVSAPITRKSDIFFIYNEIDEDSAIEIVDLLKDVVNIETLSVSHKMLQDNILELTNNLRSTTLATVYYRRTREWALPFVQQLWRITGGASSATEYLLIGEANHADNSETGFIAPKISSKLVNPEFMPIEIKVLFDKLSGKE